MAWHGTSCGCAIFRRARSRPSSSFWCERFLLGVRALAALPRPASVARRLSPSCWVLRRPLQLRKAKPLNSRVSEGSANGLSWCRILSPCQCILSCFAFDYELARAAQNPIVLHTLFRARVCNSRQIGARTGAKVRGFCIAARSKPRLGCSAQFELSKNYLH